MTWRSKIVAYSAALGFMVPVVLMLYYMIAGHFDRNPEMTILSYLCPASIASMALDNASTSTGIIVWLCISLSNAILYAFPALVVLLFVRIWKPD